MRIVLTALIVTLLVVPANAEKTRGKNAGTQQQQSSEQKKKAEAAEKAYKGALNKIPTKAADPWAGIR
jgi:hypothetical protein